MKTYSLNQQAWSEISEDSKFLGEWVKRVDHEEAIDKARRDEREQIVREFANWCEAKDYPLGTVLSFRRFIDESLPAQEPKCTCAAQTGQGHLSTCPFYKPRAQVRAQELYEDRNRHMNKWLADRQSVMSIVPGYEYKNRVDDPEWEKALERLHDALADAAPVVVASDGLRKAAADLVDALTNEFGGAEPHSLHVMTARRAVIQALADAAPEPSE